MNATISGGPCQIKELGIINLDLLDTSWVLRPVLHDFTLHALKYSFCLFFSCLKYCGIELSFCKHLLLFLLLFTTNWVCLFACLIVKRFLGCSELYNYHCCLILDYLQNPQKKPQPIFISNLSSFLNWGATTTQFSASMDLTIQDVSNKWNYTMCGLL